jgi:hypothetical protein
MHFFLKFFSFTRFGPRDILDQGDTILFGVVRVKPTEANGGRNDAGPRVQSSLEETGFLYLVKFHKDQSLLPYIFSTPAVSILTSGVIGGIALSETTSWPVGKKAVPPSNLSR